MSDSESENISTARTDEPFRPLVTGSDKITLKVRTLNSDLTCPICLCILKETVAIIACLHRFCQGCIEKSLRLGRKECPACRVKVASRRNVRRDVYFDELIKTFYPDIESAEKLHDETTNEILETRDFKNYAESAEKGAAKQALNSRVARPQSKSESISRIADHGRKHTPSYNGADNLQFYSNDNDIPFDSSEGDVGFTLRETIYNTTSGNNSEITYGDKLYLKTNGNATIYNLSKYLSNKHNNASGSDQFQPENVRIKFGPDHLGIAKIGFIPVADISKIDYLDPFIKINEISTKYWKWAGDIDFVYYFHFKKAKIN